MDSLNDALAPLKDPLSAVTRNLPAPIRDIGVSLLGDKCYGSLIIDLDFSSGNSECFSLAISKALGVAIVSASAVVKLPQLVKLVRSQSAAGLSFLSYFLETASFTISLAYNVRHGFPFSTYGETAFIAIQDVAITVLILVFSGRTPLASLFVAGIAAAAFALFSPSGIVDTELLGYLQAGAGALGVASKIPQIYTIWQSGSTGQLSAFAVFNYLIGSVTRIFTTLKEVDDKLILYGFVSGFVLNAIMAVQMVYYWNTPEKSAKTKTKAKAKVTAPKEKPIAAAPPPSVTAPPASSRKSPSTRRRG